MSVMACTNHSGFDRDEERLDSNASLTRMAGEQNETPAAAAATNSNNTPVIEVHEEDQQDEEQREHQEHGEPSSSSSTNPSTSTPDVAEEGKERQRTEAQYQEQQLEDVPEERQQQPQQQEAQEDGSTHENDDSATPDNKGLHHLPDDNTEDEESITFEAPAHLLDYESSADSVGGAEDSDASQTAVSPSRKRVAKVLQSAWQYRQARRRSSAFEQKVARLSLAKSTQDFKLHRQVDNITPESVSRKWNKQVNALLASEKLTVRNFFQRFDRDGDGLLTTKEVMHAIEHSKHINMTSDEIKLLVRTWDTDNSGTVDYKEFTSGLKYKYRKMKPNQVKRLKRTPNDSTGGTAQACNVRQEEPTLKRTPRRRRVSAPTTNASPRSPAKTPTKARSSNTPRSSSSSSSNTASSTSSNSSAQKTTKPAARTPTGKKSAVLSRVPARRGGAVHRATRTATSKGVSATAAAAASGNQISPRKKPSVSSRSPSSAPTSHSSSSSITKPSPCKARTAASSSPSKKSTPSASSSPSKKSTPSASQARGRGQRGRGQRGRGGSRVAAVRAARKKPVPAPKRAQPRRGRAGAKGTAQRSKPKQPTTGRKKTDEGTAKHKVSKSDSSVGSKDMASKGLPSTTESTVGGDERMRFELSSQQRDLLCSRLTRQAATRHRATVPEEVATAVAAEQDCVPAPAPALAGADMSGAVDDTAAEPQAHEQEEGDETAGVEAEHALEPGDVAGDEEGGDQAGDKELGARHGDEDGTELLGTPSTADTKADSGAVAAAEDTKEENGESTPSADGAQEGEERQDGNEGRPAWQDISMHIDDDAWEMVLATSLISKQRAAVAMRDAERERLLHARMDEDDELWRAAIDSREPEQGHEDAAADDEQGTLTLADEMAFVAVDCSLPMDKDEQGPPASPPASPPSIPSPAVPDAARASSDADAGSSCSGSDHGAIPSNHETQATADAEVETAAETTARTSMIAERPSTEAACPPHSAAKGEQRPRRRNGKQQGSVRDMVAMFETGAAADATPSNSNKTTTTTHADAAEMNGAQPQDEPAITALATTTTTTATTAATTTAPFDAGHAGVSVTAEGRGEGSALHSPQHDPVARESEDTPLHSPHHPDQTYHEGEEGSGSASQAGPSMDVMGSDSQPAAVPLKDDTGTTITPATRAAQGAADATATPQRKVKFARAVIQTPENSSPAVRRRSSRRRETAAASVQPHSSRVTARLKGGPARGDVSIGGSQRAADVGLLRESREAGASMLSRDEWGKDVLGLPRTARGDSLADHVHQRHHHEHRQQQRQYQDATRPPLHSTSLYGPERSLRDARKHTHLTSPYIADVGSTPLHEKSRTYEAPPAVPGPMLTAVTRQGHVYETVDSASGSRVFRTGPHLHPHHHHQQQQQQQSYQYRRHHPHSASMYEPRTNKSMAGSARVGGPGTSTSMMSGVSAPSTAPGPWVRRQQSAPVMHSAPPPPRVARRPSFHVHPEPHSNPLSVSHMPPHPQALHYQQQQQSASGAMGGAGGVAMARGMQDGGPRYHYRPTAWVPVKRPAAPTAMEQVLASDTSVHVGAGLRGHLHHQRSHTSRTHPQQFVVQQQQQQGPRSPGRGPVPMNVGTAAASGDGSAALVSGPMEYVASFPLSSASVAEKVPRKAQAASMQAADTYQGDATIEPGSMRNKAPIALLF